MKLNYISKSHLNNNTSCSIARPSWIKLSSLSENILVLETYY